MCDARLLSCARYRSGFPIEFYPPLNGEWSNDSLEGFRRYWARSITTLYGGLSFWAWRNRDLTLSALSSPPKFRCLVNSLVILVFLPPTLPASPLPRTILRKVTCRYLLFIMLNAYTSRSAIGNYENPLPIHGYPPSFLNIQSDISGNL
ncbi:hypothetical protein FA13DRAFT_701113 [Coprinellus micaceus]|uniref:Uncharacterized protein n=1 Tax=Coprinellus micaceus TaxID=71717 RepID=A0A4Y7S8A5_COPMI|nr:hypothetical protein FA13DRAFT_701113 [Coprinellus micaceus]